MNLDLKSMASPNRGGGGYTSNFNFSSLHRLMNYVDFGGLMLFNLKRQILRLFPSVIGLQSLMLISECSVKKSIVKDKTLRRLCMMSCIMWVLCVQEEVTHFL